MSNPKPDKDANDKARKMTTKEFRDFTEHKKSLAKRPHIVYLEGKKENKHRLPMPDDGDTLYSDDTVKTPPESIGGLCHENERVVISAASKASKTFLVMDLIVKLCTGYDFIGHRIDRKNRVLALNMEVARSWWRNRLVKIVDKNGAKLPKDSLTVFHFREAKVTLSEMIDDLSTQFGPGLFDWIIIDPIYALFGPLRETDSGDMQTFCDEMKRLSNNLQAGLICVHHFPKGSAAGKSSIDRMGGSGILGRWFDVIISLTKHKEEDCQTIEYDNRNGIRSTSKVLRFKYPTYEVDETLNPDDLDTGGKKTASQRPPDMSKYDAALIGRCFPRTWTPIRGLISYVRASLSVSKADAQAMLERLAAETKTKDGKSLNEIKFEDGEVITESFCAHNKDGCLKMRAR